MMSKNKDGLVAGERIEADDLLTHIAKTRVKKAQPPKVIKKPEPVVPVEQPKPVKRTVRKTTDQGE